MDLDGRHRLLELLESATHASMQALDAGLMRGLKALLRESEDNVRAAHELLLFKLKKDNAQVRYLALLLVDELFRRSAVFRALLLPAFETFLELTVGMRTDKPLPEPRSAAKRLQKKAIEVVERWNYKFGSRYRQIRLGYKYLRDVLHIKFPDLPAQARAAAQARQEAERAAQAAQDASYRKLEQEWGGIKPEVEALLRQLEQCVMLLRGGAKEFHEGEITLSTNGEAAVHFEEGWEARDNQPLVESAENAPVFESLRDSYKALCQQHLKASQTWLATLMRGRAADHSHGGGRERLLKEVLDLRNKMLAVKARCEGLGLDLKRRRTVPDGGAEEAEEGDLWEEGDVPAEDIEALQEVDEERAALGLASVEEEMAERGGMSETVQDLLEALPSGESPQEQSEARGVPQSNLVLKPGGKGLVLTKDLKGQRPSTKVPPRGTVAKRNRGADVARFQEPKLPPGPAALANVEVIEDPLPVENVENTEEMPGPEDAGVGKGPATAEVRKEAVPLNGPQIKVANPSQAPSKEKLAELEKALLRARRTEHKSSNAPSLGVRKAVTGAAANIEELRASAPVIPWGSYLDHWGAESSVPVDARGLVIENHWGPVDREATLPAERMRELSMRATYFEPEQKEIKACRAPLPNGGLCPRRDLVRCPLHGPVIPRDEQGRPVERQETNGEVPVEANKQTAESNSAVAHGGALPGSGEAGSALSDDQKQAMQRAARQAVENVRKRGREEAAEKHAARKKGGVSAQERLRDRVHNEAVLREAAIRGSQQRLGEELGGAVEDHETPRDDGAQEHASSRASPGARGGRRRGGAAQLTPRQRIERRLLNARVRNATTNVLESEESRRIQTLNANRWENR